jgi:hypothetical protein
MCEQKQMVGIPFLSELLGIVAYTYPQLSISASEIPIAFNSSNRTLAKSFCFSDDGKVGDSGSAVVSI